MFLSIKKVLLLKALKHSSPIARPSLTSTVILMCQLGFKMPTVKVSSRLLNTLPIGIILVAKLRFPINDCNC
ncbi:hypothetical protein XELAEV_18004034mg, partial [Xenopus laevis]